MPSDCEGIPEVIIGAEVGDLEGHCDPLAVAGQQTKHSRAVALRGTCIATRSHADSPASQLTTSPSLPLSWPRPISTKPELSRAALISGPQAHTGA